MFNSYATFKTCMIFVYLRCLLELQTNFCWSVYTLTCSNPKATDKAEKFLCLHFQFVLESPSPTLHLPPPPAEIALVEWSWWGEGAWITQLIHQLSAMYLVPTFFWTLPSLIATSLVPTANVLQWEPGMRLVFFITASVRIRDLLRTPAYERYFTL